MINPLIIINGLMPHEYAAPISSIIAPNIIENKYFITTFGRVYDLEDEYFLTQYLRNSGYYCVSVRTTIDRMLIDVHRIELLTFNYNPNYKNLYVNHIDGIKTHNFIYNLEWVTPSENMIHASQHGLLATGENHKNCTISDNTVRDICELYIDGFSYADISRKLNLNQGTVKDIITGKVRRPITSQYDLQIREKKIFSDEEIHIICQVFSSNKGIPGYKLYDIISSNLNRELGDREKHVIKDLYHRDPRRFVYITSQYDY